MAIFKTMKKLWFRKHHYRQLSNAKKFLEVAIPVPWGNIRGKWWGPTDKRPILTLHGWQDNCGSFDRLIPLLNNDVGFLAIDLPGHGYSSRLPVGVPYNITTYLSAIQYTKKHLGWSQLTLMGHSFGGITSFTYTMMYPDEVDFLICIDGAKQFIPKFRKNRLAKSFDTFIKNSDLVMENNEPPSYTMEEIRKKVIQPNHGSIHTDVAHYLLERSIARSKTQPDKYYFTRDPRLKAEAFIYVSQEESVYMAQYIRCPVFIAKAKGFGYFEPKENYYKVMEVLKRTVPDFEHHYVEGTHHAHLNNPGAELSSLINNFIKKYDLVDRNVGGLKADIIIDERIILKTVVRSK
ncbi:probable serine hydrolase [Sitophilus oryzae]|uniref:Probable serine hydrolase n=1 Tax=Sitophilus oryzae TaxID=7048 RepID=A0A6J2Y924_SITOR|nr:probable serine hydrolase [Sitophilus oryzae]